MLVACTKDDSKQNESKGIITMATAKFGLFEPIVAGSGTIIIDYDGQPWSFQVPEEAEGSFINWNKGYTLDGQPRTITITGNIVGLLCYDEQLTDLDVSRCKTLEYLGCVKNQLTSLDVSNNTALEFLHCQENHQLVNIYVWSGFDVSNPPVSWTKDDTTNFVVKK